MENKNIQNTAEANSKEIIEAAKEQAEQDIEQDVDLNNTSDPANDLDEGELARLEGEE